MARKTIFVSDLTGRTIDENDAATVTIRYADARKGQVVLDVNSAEVADLAAKAPSRRGGAANRRVSGRRHTRHGRQAQRGIDAYASQLGLDRRCAQLVHRSVRRALRRGGNPGSTGAWMENGDLDPRERSLIVVAALIAQGDVDERLRGHVRWAVAHGATRQQLEEAVTLLATYVGYPRASTGMEIVRAELDRLESA